MIIIIAGFVTAGLTIQAAFMEWHDSPVITTLDSIAAPVTSIQFPTITVCQEEFHRKDNWAILENILNFIAFECTYDPNDTADYRYWASCNETVKVRQDFEFLITSVIDFFKKEWKRDVYKNSTIDEYRQVLLDLLNQGITIEALTSLPMNCFAKYWYGFNGDLPNDLVKQFQKNLTHPVSNIDDETQKLIKVVDSLITFLKLREYPIINIRAKEDGQYMRFGSFVSNFIPLKKFNSFIFTNLAYDEFLWADGFDYDEFGPIRFSCGTALDENEFFIHDYFSSLSTSIGFDNSSKISLFDIPSILANIDDSTDTRLTKLHPFLYTRCQREDESQFVNYYDCVKEWNSYLESKGSSEKYISYLS